MPFELGPVLSMLLAATAPLSEPAHSPEAEPVICVTVARNWRGTLEDVRRIAIEPVPESYRQSYGWTDCQHLVKESLIEWHLAFGDERSTTQALRFLADTALEGMPSVERFEATMPLVWRKAETAIARQSIKSNAIGLERQRQGDTPLSKQIVGQLRSLIEAHDRYSLLAGQYLRAAEFFNSKALLDDAARYLARMNKAGVLLYGNQRVALASSWTPVQIAAGLQAREVNMLHDFQMRYAIAKARISRSPIDLVAAAAVIDQNDDQVMRDAARTIMDRTEYFCKSASATEAPRTSCRIENNLAGRLRSFWRSLAQLELAKGTHSLRVGSPYSVFDIAVRAIYVAHGETIPDRIDYDAAADDHVALLIAKADAQFRQWQSADSDKKWSLREGALADLFRAERLTPVSLNPNRFRQIADLYLTVFRATRLDGQFELPEQALHAAYLEEMLNRLGSITAGLR